MSCFLRAPASGVKIKPWLKDVYSFLQSLRPSGDGRTIAVDWTPTGCTFRSIAPRSGGVSGGSAPAFSETYGGDFSPYIIRTAAPDGSESFSLDVVQTNALYPDTVASDNQGVSGVTTAGTLYSEHAEEYADSVSVPRFSSAIPASGVLSVYLVVYLKRYTGTVFADNVGIAAKLVKRTGAAIPAAQWLRAMQERFLAVVPVCAVDSGRNITRFPDCCQPFFYCYPGYSGDFAVFPYLSIEPEDGADLTDLAAIRALTKKYYISGGTVIVGTSSRADRQISGVLQDTRSAYLELTYTNSVITSVIQEGTHRTSAGGNKDYIDLRSWNAGNVFISWRY